MTPTWRFRTWRCGPRSPGSPRRCTAAGTRLAFGIALVLSAAVMASLTTTAFAQVDPQADQKTKRATPKDFKDRTITSYATTETVQLVRPVAYWLTPGCKSEVLRSVTIKVAPLHGKAEVRDESWIPRDAGLDLAKDCSEPLAGKAVYYRSDDGFLGRDAIEIEVIRANGAVELTKYFLNVKPRPIYFVKPGQALTILRESRADWSCNPRPAPTVQIDSQPAGGIVESVIGDGPMRKQAPGQNPECAGHSAPTNTVTYRASAGFMGREQLDYTIINAWSPPVHKSIIIQVTDQLPAGAADPTRAVEPEPQVVGPLPAPRPNADFSR